MPETDVRSLAAQSVDRTLANRQATYEDEISRLVEATYTVMARSGDLSPTVRDIVGEADLSNQAFYRHFRSKDELLLVVLDDGRRRLMEHLERRMNRADDPVAAIGAWIRGVMAQAADSEAAARTRPFVADIGRLTERYPDEQRSSERLLIEPLEAAIRSAAALGLASPLDPARDATAIYGLTLQAMEAHIRADTRPNRPEIAHLVSFALTALGVEVDAD